MTTERYDPASCSPIAQCQKHTASLAFRPFFEDHPNARPTTRPKYVPARTDYRSGGGVAEYGK